MNFSRTLRCCRSRQTKHRYRIDKNCRKWRLKNTALKINRFKADGRVESGFFLLDVFCLGVKDAGFHCFNGIADYQGSLLDRLYPGEDAVRMTPAAARKLAEDAISYARGLGFSPGAITKRRAAFSGASRRRTAMRNLRSAKTTNHSTSRGRQTRRRASRGFCVRSKPGAARAATITSSLRMTLSRSRSRRKTAKTLSLVLSIE